MDEIQCDFFGLCHDFLSCFSLREGRCSRWLKRRQLPVFSWRRDVHLRSFTDPYVGTSEHSERLTGSEFGQPFFVFA